MAKSIKLNDDTLINFMTLGGHMTGQTIDDLNNLNKSGFHFVLSANNMPTNDATYFVWCFSYADNRVIQFAYTIAYPYILHMRYRLNDTWYPWKSITFS